MWSHDNYSHKDSDEILSNHYNIAWDYNTSSR